MRLAPEYGEDGLPTADSLLKLFDRVTALLRSGEAVACYTPGFGGIAEAVLKMAIGNGIGVELADGLSMDVLFGYDYGAFLLETVKEIPDAELIGRTVEKPALTLNGEELKLSDLLTAMRTGLRACTAATSRRRTSRWRPSPSRRTSASLPQSNVQSRRC